MNESLFKFALDRLEPSDWAQFERLCSAFLSTEFSSLRTMATASGDGGRDAELYSPDNSPIIAIQYSVTSHWNTKIKDTIKRISKTFPDIRILIYMSNQVIGAECDKLKQEALKQGFSVDIRDRSWFLERVNTNANREQAAQKLANRIAVPYLASEKIINKAASPLSTKEARAALLYLGLQWQDDASDKGLTKLSFDALVRAALRNSTADNRMSRQSILDTVYKMLPSADTHIVKPLIESALARLTKKYIRHWPQDDHFCLTHEERLRIQAHLADVENQQALFRKMIHDECEACLRSIKVLNDEHCNDLESRVPRIIERFLLRRGECFASSVLSEQLDRLGVDELASIIHADVTLIRPPKAIIKYFPQLIVTIVRSIFSSDSPCLQPYLRKLSASYTLFSFLNQTPDVQNATRKLFSHGTIWVDTSVLLPLIAEQLETDDSQKRLSRLFATCDKLGIELRVTSGVVQEVNAHMNNAITCSRSYRWEGRVPYLYYQYIRTGGNPNGFASWASAFRGDERPDDDLAQFLSEVFQIQRKDFDGAHVGVDDELRHAIDRLWSEAHIARRANGFSVNDPTTRLLIKHDVETYLGVISLRKGEQVSELGYKHWLLTLDSIAWAIRDKLVGEFPARTPPSPLMSLSYLLDCITFGASRMVVGKTDEMSLPLILDVEMSESMPHDFIKLAEDERSKSCGIPDFIVRRNVRDAIDKARRKKGCLGHLEQQEEAH